MIRRVLGMMAAMSMMMGLVMPVVSVERPDATVQYSLVELFCLVFPNSELCRGRV